MVQPKRPLRQKTNTKPFLKDNCNFDCWKQPFRHKCALTVVKTLEEQL